MTFLFMQLLPAVYATCRAPRLMASYRNKWRGVWHIENVAYKMVATSRKQQAAAANGGNVMAW